MITKVWILGELEVAFYLQDEQYGAIKLDANSPSGYSGCSVQIPLYEQSGAEQRLLEQNFDSVDAILPELKIWSARHQLLNYFIYPRFLSWMCVQRQEKRGVARRNF